MYTFISVFLTQPGISGATPESSLLMSISESNVVLTVKGVQGKHRSHDELALVDLATHQLA